VDQVAGGQDGERHLGIEIQLPRQTIDRGEVGWTELGEEGAKQASVELLEWSGQGSLAIGDATGRRSMAASRIAKSPNAAGRGAWWLCGAP
jgi:hypothetical protein